MLFLLGAVAAKSQTADAGKAQILSQETPVLPETIQAGFFTPKRAGMIWDTWIYYHEGRYYMYYLAGAGGHWDGHELATSEDGVHWKEHGVMVKPRAGVTWMAGPVPDIHARGSPIRRNQGRRQRLESPANLLSGP